MPADEKEHPMESSFPPSRAGAVAPVYPLITLRDLVIPPHSVRPFVVGRPSSVASATAALESDGRVFLLLQRDPRQEDPKPDEMYRVGVVANILQSIALPNGHYKVVVEGLYRGEVVDFLLDGPIHHVSIRPLPDGEADAKAESLVVDLVRRFEAERRKNPNLFGGLSLSSLNPEDPPRFADQIASLLSSSAEMKQKVLEALDPSERLALVRKLFLAEMAQITLDQQLNREVEKQIEKTQKEYFLNEKMKLIRKELGREDSAGELEELRERIEKAGMPEGAKERALSELKRLEVMPPVSAEATVSRSYIDWLLSLPWSKETKDRLDIRRAEKILDEDHYGLEKVKERILEFLSVRQLTKDPKGSILCFVGPPGVGKTSVARSIARSMGREFVRLSLGGVHDEAEIKGHRRTYIGAFPGQIVQLIKRAGSRNPLFLLDEIDKLGADYRGDPASALLEVLDPEQNHAFLDHYIDVPFDLSRVFFVTTANVTHTIPPALLDRLEVIPFSGYTLPEKRAIAEGYLVPKQTKAHGLRKGEVTFTEEGLAFLIDGYTREAGVRNLEREIASLCRKVAHRVVKERRRAREVLTPERVEALLGVPRYKERKILQGDEVGVAVGLAWTQAGGDILLVEASLMPGKGNLTLTGQLGDVMQESARAAFSYIRGQSSRLDLKPSLHAESDVHVHVPEGAIPKDGPSAGVALAAAMVSAFTGIPVRHDVAMTGEVTLRGKVLPVGGLKEKILAARQHDLAEVILPADNRKDLLEIPEDLRKGLRFTLVQSLEEVFRAALAADPFQKRAVPMVMERGEGARPEKAP